MNRRAAIIVLDGVGIGAAPDAADYGDTGSNTLGNIARVIGGLRLPNLERAGLGRIGALQGMNAEPSPTASVWPELAPYVPRRDGSWFC